MALKVFDRVQETTTSTGTGTINLNGASTGYRAFSSVFTTGDLVPYCITDDTNWEVGEGTLTTGTPWTLARTTVIASSNGGSAISVTSGMKVFCTASASYFNSKAALGANTFTGDQALGNNNLTGVKVLASNSVIALSTTSGSVNIDWSAGQRYSQNAPTGTITYTFTNPPGPCRLFLRIDTGATAQTINLPTATQIGTAWTPVNAKKAYLTFEFDGTNYHYMGANQV